MAKQSKTKTVTQAQTKWEKEAAERAKKAARVKQHTAKAASKAKGKPKAAS